MDSKCNTNIHGVIVTPLKIIEDNRGAVMHMMKSTSIGYNGFGEVYFSVVKSGVIKGWKRHKKMTQNFVVPHGLIELIVIDHRKDSPTLGQSQRIILGKPESYCRVTVPPRLWYAFKAISPTEAILTNCADLPHDPLESEVKQITGDGVEYAW